MPNETRKQLWGFCESCHCQQIAVCEDCKKLLRETVNEAGAALNRDNDSLDTWVEIRSEADLPKVGDCYETTQDLEDGGEPMSWPLHYDARTKQWFEDIELKQVFEHPVLAWKNRCKPYIKQPDASTEGHRECPHCTHTVLDTLTSYRKALEGFGFMDRYKNLNEAYEAGYKAGTEASICFASGRNYGASFMRALKERSMLDPDAPDAIAVATDQKEVKWLHNRLKK